MSTLPVNNVDTWRNRACTGVSRTNEGHPIATNTAALIAVSVLVTLALAGMVMVVRHKCRDERNFLGGNGLLDEAEDDARLVRHHADLADESAAKAQAARVDGDIAAFRDRARRKDAAPHTSETAHLRELLDDRTDRPA